MRESWNFSMSVNLAAGNTSKVTKVSLVIRPDIYKTTNSEKMLFLSDWRQQIENTVINLSVWGAIQSQQ